MQKIQILDEIEHIRKRKGMYIGSSEDITHLIEELLDNALDEVVNGYAKNVTLIKEKFKYTVIDDGRGLPVYYNQQYEEDIPVLLCSKLFSGGKFSKDNYQVSVGLNGVGLVVVNALSSEMEIEIYHSCKSIKESQSEIKDVDFSKLDKCKFVRFLYRFEDSQLVTKDIEYLDINKKPFSTRISFVPNKQYFKRLTYDDKFINNRLKIASIFTGAKIFWKHDKYEKTISENLENYFQKEVKYKSKYFTPLINIHYKNKENSEGIDLIMTWNLEENSYQFKSSVNLLPVEQGTHINHLNLIIQNLFEEYKKKYKYTFNKTDCLIGLRYYFNIYLLNTEFSSQTKEKLTTDKQEFEYIFDQVYKKLKSYFNKNEDVLLTLLEKFQNYRHSLSAKRTIRTVSNTNVRGLTNKDSRLRDCTSKTIEKTELLICEGESASGSLIQCRDYKRHAILPLKGKTINVMSSDIDKILNNKEIIDIIKSIGVGMKIKEDDKLDLSKIRYEKIILVADADPDGGHILCLLMAALLKFVPDIVKEGYVYICLPPLFAAKNKNEYHTFYSREELDEFLSKTNKKYDIIRYKGLGEMNPEEMKIAAIDEKTRKLIQIQYPETEKEIKEIYQLLTSAEKRRELLNNVQELEES